MDALELLITALCVVTVLVAFVYGYKANGKRPQTTFLLHYLTGSGIMIWSAIYFLVWSEQSAGSYAECLSGVLIGLCLVVTSPLFAPVRGLRRIRAVTLWHLEEQ